MELYSFNIKKIQETETTKKIPYISRNGNPKRASYISGNGTFQPKPPKIKKILPKKTPFIFREMEFSNPKMKKLVIFSQKKAFLIFFQVIFRRYIQNPDILRTRNIFRTLA